MISLPLHAAVLLAPVLVAALWQGTLLAVAAAALLHLLPGLSAAVRSRVWTTAFLLSAILPFLSLVAFRPEPRHAGVHAARAVALVAVALWFAAALLRAAQLVRSAIHLRAIARRALPVFTAVPMRIEVCTSPEVGVPSVFGFLHPRILIPATLYATLSPIELHHIVLHETEHLRRRDHWTNLLQKFTLVVLPVSPALLWMERRLCLERELACDDGVLRATGTGRAYATTLANLAEHRLLRRTVSLALGAFRHRSEVKRRIQRLLRPPVRETSPRLARMASILTLAALLTTATALTRVPRLVEFTSEPTATTATAAEQPMPTGLHSAPRFEPANFAEAASASVQHVVFRPQTLRARVSRRIRRAVRFSSAPRRAATNPSEPTSSAAAVQRRSVSFASEDAPTLTVLTYAAVPTRAGWLIFQL